MNRNYKVIWNQSLNCFMAVAEYAKSRGKSSSTVSSTSTASAAVSSGARLLRLSALSVGLVSAGLSISPQVFAFTGDGGTAAGSNAIAIGGLSTTARAGNQGNQSVAIGYDAQVSGDQSVGLGANVRATGNSSIAIGGDDLDSASRTNQNGTLATDLNGGDINTIFKKYSGRDLVNTANRYPSTSSSGAAAVAVGVQAVASGGLSTAFGTQTKASGVASSAFGVSASADKEGSVAIGAGSKTDGIATKVDKETVNGIEFTGFTGNNSFAGNATDAGRQVSVGLIGNERQIKNVAPGAISASSTDAINGSQLFSVAKTLSSVQQPVVYTNAAGTRVYKQPDGTFNTVIQPTTATPGTVVAAANIITSIQNANGSTTAPAKLTNVAAGTINATSNDAVNGSQLNTTNTRVANNTTALGGSYDAAGVYTAPIYEVVANPSSATTTSFNTVKGAVEQLSSAVQTPLTFTGNTGTTDRKLGQTLAITGSGNLSTVSSATGVAISLSDTPTFTSVTTGNSLLNNTGLTITGGPSITTNGINAANNNITNVADGSIAANSKDAINGGQVSTLVNTVTGQLNTTNANVTDNTNRSTGNMTALGGSYDAANNVYTPPSYSVFTNPSETGPTGTGNGTGDTVNTVGGAITAINSALQTPLTFAGDTGTNVTRQLGQTLAVKGGITTATDLTDNNIGVVANDTDSSLTIKLAKSLTGLTSVTTGNTTLNNSGVTILSSTGGDTVILNSSGLNNGNNKIAAVANGDISTNSKDAVNGGQINTLVNTATTAINNNATNITDNTNRSIGNMTALGGSYDAATDTYTPPEYVLDDGTNSGTNAPAYNTVSDALDNLDGRTATNTGDIADLTNTVAQQRVKYVDVNSTGGINENNDGATGLDAIAIGKGTRSTGVGSFAAGVNALSQGDNSLAIGTGAQSILAGASAVGRNAVAAGFNTVAVGDSSRASSIGDVAIGYNARSDGGGATNIAAVALGTNSKALGNGNVAIGNAAAATNGNHVTAIGESATSTGNRSMAVGYGANAAGVGATSFGEGASAVGRFAVAIKGNASADSAIALGGTASAENAIALGGTVTASAANSVSIGRGSVANGTTLSTAAYQPLDANGNAISVTLPTAAAEVNIGNRRLTGLAAGATDTDAVNVSQLKAVNTNVITNTTNLNNLTTGVTGIVRQDAGTGAITVGGQTGGTSVSFANSNDDARNITGVADGDISVGSTDAVNGGQINTLVNTATTAINNNATNITDNTNRSTGNLAVLGGGAKYDSATDTYTPPKYILDNSTTTVNTVGEALGNLDGRITTNTSNIANLNNKVNGIDFPIRSSNAKPFKTTATGINTLAVGSNATASGIGSTAVGEGANANSSINATAIGQNAKANSINATAIGQGANANSINTTAIGVGASANSINATAIGVGASSGFSGLAGGQGANASMSSVALGAQSAASAMGSVAIGNNSSATVNGGVALGQNSVANVAGGATGFVPTAALTADQDAITATDSTNLGAVSVGTGTAGGNRQIVNVAAGTNDSDAVNVSQLKSVANVANQGFNITADNRDLANNETEDNVQLGETIDFTNTDNNLVATVSDNGINYDLAEDIDLGEDGSVTTGNTVTDNTGVTITDSTNTAIKTTITTAGTNVTDGNGNTGNYGAATTVLTDNSGNTNASAAIGNAIFDDSGNANLSGAIGNAIFDDSGNANLSGAQGNIIFDDSDNVTTTSATGTNVTDGTNTSDYGANGLVATDDKGNSTIVNQTGLSFTNTNGTTTPSITAAGIDAGDTVITNVANGTVAANSQDATNGGQLFNTAESVKNVIGGNAINTGGVITTTNIGGTGATTIDGAITSVKDAATKAKTTVTEGKNITVTASTNANGSTDYNVKTKDALDLTSVTTGNTVTNNNGVTITDGANITALTSAGTNVTDGTNTSDYGANGFTVTDGTDTTTINQTGLSFTDANGATGPSITAAGIDVGDTVITNVGDAINAGDAVNKGQLDNLSAGAVQYERDNGNINYDQVTFAGTKAVIEQDEDGNDVVISGGTRLSNVANAINAADAINKGQLDSLIAQNITDVEVTDQNGNPVTVNITDQVVNRNTDNSNLDSLFLTYNVEGQDVTDRLTIGETVQRMNTEGVKFAHTNAVNAQGDIGITNDSSAGGDNSTAIGVNAIIAEGADSTVALGHNTDASANAINSVVIGNDSQVAGQSSIAIGDGSKALGNQSISVGTGNIVRGNNAGAFGDPSIINGNNSYSVGNNNTIDSDDTFVFGNNVTSTVEGSVVLGTGSAATTGAGVAGYLSAGNAAITATTSTTGAVAVGDASNGVYRQVTGVAAGTADSDAVNVSQLKAVSDTLQSNNEALSNAAVKYDKNADGTINKGSITLGGGAAGTTITNVSGGAINASSTDAINGSQLYNLGNDVAGVVGGNAAVDNDGNLTVSNIGGTGADNLNDAIAAVNNGNAQANAGIQANADRLNTGLSFSADSGTNVDKSIGDSTALKFEGSNNITTTTTDSGIKFDLNGNISVDNITAATVTTGNTTVNTDGVTIKDGPSVTAAGIDAGDKVITGVADGLEVTDAVNFGQLSALDSKLSNSVNELGYKINEVEDDANAGISAAMAMSSLPQAYIPGKSMVGGGIATYNGQSAVAVGVSKVSDNGRWVIKVNGTADTQGNAGGAVGAGFHF